MSLIIFTDSNSDLPLQYLKDNDIAYLGVSVNFKGKEYFDDFGESLKYKDFYDGIRAGEMPGTAQINAFRFEEEFKKYVSKGDSIIYIAFSSALSGTYNSALIAREEVLNEFPEADISVIDSKSASMGLGLLVYYANEMKKNGKSKDEIVDWIVKNKLNAIHFFTVDDLNHLKRGGRVSSAAAVIGTLLNIKPILHVNEEGKLIPIDKVKGRKKAIKTLFEKMKEHIVNPKDQVIFISHGDCEEEANILAELIKNELPLNNIIINNIGPGVGTHSGPGTIALFFLGDTRKP